jgi:Putative Ig domain
LGYPIWQTNSTDLGKISAQEFFNIALEAVDSDGTSDIKFDLIAGQLPRGLRIDTSGYIFGNPESIYALQGVPFATNKDIDSLFTIRATNVDDGKITDKTFKITVTGNIKPEILTIADPLGTFKDGTEINIQLDAVDLNNDTLTWKLITGELPKGVSFTNNGVISGIIEPYIYEFSSEIPGWSESKWNIVAWDFETRSNFKTYNFTVSVSDTKATVLKSYRICVLATNDLRADTTSLTCDSATITADLTPDRPVILKTKTLGDFSTVNSGGYYAFQFEAIDWDIADITYELTLGVNEGWDADTSYWDVDTWDRFDLALPPGLTLDEKTGWLTGYIPPQQATQSTFNFGIAAYSNGDITTKSEIRYFSLTILGNLNLDVAWLTNADLGYIDVGAVSQLSVNAVAKSGRPLIYNLKNGSKLPQGLQLLKDGTLSGRVSFQNMSFDSGTTTFDKKLASQFVYTRETNFDNIYTFTVIANDYNNEISAERTFTVKVLPVINEPYDNLYIQCLPSVEKRNLIQNILSNTDIIDPNDVYRPIDPYFGVVNNLKFLVGYGIKTSKMSEYIAAMQDRHFKKKFYFGDYKIAQGKDINGNVIYDILYVDLIEDTKVYDSKGIEQPKIPAAFTNINSKKANWRNPRAKDIPSNKISSDNILSVDKTYIKTNDNFFAFEPLNVISPNDLTLMQNDVANALRKTYANSLPEWMISVQDNGKIIGYTTAVPLAYLQPNTGAKALYLINEKNTYDIKNVPFAVDRYILNNSYSANFDLDRRKFTSHKYTTFDASSRAGTAITPVFDVDFAVARPFSSINGQKLDYVIETGGFDGVDYNINQKYIIFSQQERFNETSWGTLTNDGWIIYETIVDNWAWDDTVGWDSDVWDKFDEPNNTIIPGYIEKSLTPTLPNRRGGVWQIKVDQYNIVTLTFIKEVNPNEYIYVIQGNTKGNSIQLYDLSFLQNGYTLPAYSQAQSSVYVKRPETTFDKRATVFINNIETYTLPGQGDKYLAFPKIGVFTNGQ